MDVDQRTIASAAVRMGFNARPLMVDSSLASFGPVRGGAQAVLDGLLEGGRTRGFGAFDEVLTVVERRKRVGNCLARVSGPSSDRARDQGDSSVACADSLPSGQLHSLRRRRGGRSPPTHQVIAGTG